MKDPGTATRNIILELSNKKATSQIKLVTLFKLNLKFSSADTLATFLVLRSSGATWAKCYSAGLLRYRVYYLHQMTMDQNCPTVLFFFFLR